MRGLQRVGMPVFMSFSRRSTSMSSSPFTPAGKVGRGAIPKRDGEVG